MANEQQPKSQPPLGQQSQQNQGQRIDTDGDGRTRDPNELGPNDNGGDTETQPSN